MTYPQTLSLFCWNKTNILPRCPVGFHRDRQSSFLTLYYCFWWTKNSSLSKSHQGFNMESLDCMQAFIFRLAVFIFSSCFDIASGCKAQTGHRLDWDSNCHFESDKVLICPPATERLDITVDKWAVEQNWQEAREDKMPSARVFFSICYHSWTTAS